VEKILSPQANPIQKQNLPITSEDTIVFAGGMISADFAWNVQQDPAWESRERNKA
jgi:hypothetical protein